MRFRTYLLDNIFSTTRHHLPCCSQRTLKSYLVYLLRLSPDKHKLLILMRGIIAGSSFLDIYPPPNVWGGGEAVRSQTSGVCSSSIPPPACAKLEPFGDQQWPDLQLRTPSWNSSVSREGYHRHSIHEPADPEEHPPMSGKYALRCSPNPTSRNRHRMPQLPSRLPNTARILLLCVSRS